MRKFTVLIILFGVCCVKLLYVHAGSESQMRELLFAKLNSSDYSPRVRPIKDTGNTLNLTVDMYLISINKVEEVEQKITTTLYLKLVWYDSFMEWDPTEFGNLTEFSLPQDEIWKPDIALANAYDTIAGLGDKFMYVTVTNDGKISWEPFQRFVSTCSLRMKYFPFDVHICDIQMATWSSTKQMISIITGSDGFNIDLYEENANWNLDSVSTFDSSTVATSGLSFSLKISRKPIYYILNTIFPIILLSVLNNFVFVLPCSSGEKLSFAIILFLSFTIFLLILTEIMPEGISSIPVITIYLLLESIFSTLFVLISIIQLRLHNRENRKPVPKVFKKYTRSIQKMKNCIFGDSGSKTKQADGNVRKLDGDQIKRSNAPIQETFFHTKPKEQIKNTNESRNLSNKRDCVFSFKRKLICGANKVHNDDVNDDEYDAMKTRMTHISSKTTFTLANILGKSNRVEPEAFFNKPNDVVPMYPDTNADDEIDTPALENDAHGEKEHRNMVKKFLQMDSISSVSEASSLSSRAAERSKYDITWSEFVLAVDNTLFVVSIIINTITTAVTLFISMTS